MEESRPEFGNEITAPGIHAALEEVVDPLPREGGVLDLGCGAGAWLRRLRAMGFTDLVGVDRFTRPIDEDGLSIRVVDDLESSDLGLGNMKFALVTMIEVIEHMTSPGVLLAHASQHLANDGVILITTPNIHSLIQRLKFLGTGRFGHFDAGSDPTHFQPLLLDAWERMLPKWNLEVERRWTIPDANVFGGVSFVWRLGASVLAPILGNPLPGECLGLMLRRVSIP